MGAASGTADGAREGKSTVEVERTCRHQLALDVRADAIHDIQPENGLEHATARCTFEAVASTHIKRGAWKHTSGTRLGHTSPKQI